MAAPSSVLIWLLVTLQLWFVSRMLISTAQLAAAAQPQQSSQTLARLLDSASGLNFTVPSYILINGSITEFGFGQVGMPNLDDGLFFPILSSPSFNASFNVLIIMVFRSVSTSRAQKAMGQMIRQLVVSLYLAVCAGSRLSSYEERFIYSLDLNYGSSRPYGYPGYGRGLAIPVWIANLHRPIKNALNASLEEKKKAVSATSQGRRGASGHTPSSACQVSYKELRIATKGFYELLGAGGCGSVYAGTLSDGRRVAMKVLEGVLQGVLQSRDFLAEVATVGRTGHHNILRLVGFCWQVLHRILVYEYVERGSLDRWLFGGERDTLLDWQKGYNIALGVARGLHYLHENCKQAILHFDIKPQNILLDRAFVAKISDFGCQS
ncbi:hypothetical protein L7F22_064871 [Adiantum nelumboides]|nr:hypothetical protein [Adiantum nelumboides]